MLGVPTFSNDIDSRRVRRDENGEAGLRAAAGRGVGACYMELQL